MSKVNIEVYLRGYSRLFERYISQKPTFLTSLQAFILASVVFSKVTFRRPNFSPKNELSEKKPEQCQEEAYYALLETLESIRPANFHVPSLCWTVLAAQADFNFA